LSDEFKHENYSNLILLTTQKFGRRTSLNGWNEKNVEERLKIIKDIFNRRTEKEINDKQRKPIVALQVKVCNTDEIKLREVLQKVAITTEADNLEEIRHKILQKIDDIPDMNKQKYMEGLIGFVYESAIEKTGWHIPYRQFKEKRIELTSTYCRKCFTFPRFSGRNATEREQFENQEKLFVQKILDIQHESEIPEAIGNWLELHNSLREEIDGRPQYLSKTKEYQSELIRKFCKKYQIKQRNVSDAIKDSKNLYDEVISENPTPIPIILITPPLAYKNGLIHDSMDNEVEKLKWRIEE
jgi:hypothetical protein